MNLSTSDRLRQEYDRFVEFGNLLDRKTRKYLVEYLQSKVDPREQEKLDRSALEELNDRYFGYFKQALDELFTIQDLLTVCRRNERITEQILLDTLQWLRKTYDQVRTKNPYEKEANYLENYAVTPLHVFIKRWHVLLAYLQQISSGKTWIRVFTKTVSRS